MMRVALLLLVYLLILSCTQDQQTPSQEVYPTVQIDDGDFAEESEVAPTIAEGFVFKLWAPGPLLSNAVAVSFDNQGVAYVAETQRRKTSDIDIRQHRDWMTEDLELQSIEDTEAFHKRKLATDLTAENEWQPDFNEDGLHDYRDLSVQSEVIRRVWDSDGDGRADASQVFAKGFNDMLTGIAAGILHHNGEVFLTAAPDVFRLNDTDQDGQADEREVIAHGFGIHIAYAGHDMSGLTIGPDGRLYWSIGDIGVNVVDQEGKRWEYPNEGAVMRCNPDGSDFEVYAHGLRNPQELAFDAYGNLMSVDNDGDHPGERERYVHILEGSDSGWRINWQFGKYNNEYDGYKVWMDEQLSVPHFKDQAAYLLPALALAPDGPAGLAFNPGTALGEDWNNYFFASYFKGSAVRSKLDAFKTERQGASFRIAEVKNVITGIASTGVNFGPDGALYINDWKDGYALKPEGRIWQLDVVAQRQNNSRERTRKLLAEGFSASSLEDLAMALDNDDQRIRLAAQFELVDRNLPGELLKKSHNATTEFGRLHAIWGFGQLCRKDSDLSTQIVPLLLDPNPNIRSQTAKILGDAKCTDAGNDLLPLLQDKDAFVQYFAAEALGKIGFQPAFDPLVTLLEKTGDSDPHMRHGLNYALSKLNLADRLASLVNHSSRDVRVSAVVALRHMRSEKVAPFLNDADSWIATEAARAIHDDHGIPAALPALAKALARTEIKEQAFVRRAINANLRLGKSVNAANLVAYSEAFNVPKDMVVDALWALAQWKDPPVLDRVEGRYRTPIALEYEKAAELAKPRLEMLLSSPNQDLQTVAAKAIGRLEITSAEDKLFELISNDRQPNPVRMAALTSLHQMKSERSTSALELALNQNQEDLRKIAQSLLGEADLPASTVAPMLAKLLSHGSISEQQMALVSLGKMDDPSALPILADQLEMLFEGSLEPGISLDLINAVSASGDEELLKKLQIYEESRGDEHILVSYSETLYGGDPKKGQDILAFNESGQCLRCHEIQGYGGQIGPSLTGIADQLSREEMLLSLIDPSASIAAGYGTVSLTDAQGNQVAGTLISETKTELVLKDGSGNERSYLITEIKDREDYPSGMLDMKPLLSKNEIRDLMAFLMTLKNPEG